jgi:hypothetical protein
MRGYCVGIGLGDQMPSGVEHVVIKAGGFDGGFADLELVRCGHI